jgi:signal transduction histidine kinase
MSIKRALGFLALMIFIFVVVVLLARSSIMELRTKAEAEFSRQRWTELKDILYGKGSIEDPLYRVDADGGVHVLNGSRGESNVGAILGLLPQGPAGLRMKSEFWVSLPLEGGGYILSCTPYDAVIAWTAGFEAKETRNVVLVMAAFIIFALVWMWADRRALVAGQKARMVEELERLVKERTEALKRMKGLARLGEFAASLAHEIRNPLGSLVTSAKLLPDSTREEHEELVGVIKRESGRLDRILSDFLFFSKEPRLKIEMHPLNELVQRGIDGLKRRGDFKRMAVLCQFDARIKNVPCDPEQLEQVIWNIAINGAHAMKGKGKLTISTVLNGPWAEIKFRDQGKGVSKEEQERIFEPFYTKKAKGTGLGLSIASRIIEAHSGFIQVESDGNSWSQFTVSLPLGDER